MPTVIQQVGNFAVSGSSPCTVSFTPKVSGSIIVFFAYCQVGTPTFSVSDPANGAYAPIVSNSNTNFMQAFWVKNTTSSTITITLTESGYGPNIWILAIEVSGQATSPIGSSGSGAGSLNNSTYVEIDTSGSISANAGDAVLIASGSYTGIDMATATHAPAGCSQLTLGTNLPFGVSGVANLGSAYSGVAGNSVNAYNGSSTMGVVTLAVVITSAPSMVTGTMFIAARASAAAAGGQTLSGSAAVKAGTALSSFGFKADNIGGCSLVLPGALSAQGGQTLSGAAALALRAAVLAAGGETFSGSADVAALLTMAASGAPIFSGNLRAAIQAAAQSAGVNYPPIRLWPRITWSN